MDPPAGLLEEERVRGDVGVGVGLVADALARVAEGSAESSPRVRTLVCRPG